MTTVSNIQNEKKKDGRIVLIWLVGFFLSFMIVDAFMVYKAVTTQTGVVDLVHGK